MIQLCFCLLTGIVPVNFHSWLAAERNTSGFVNLDLLFSGRRSEEYLRVAKEEDQANLWKQRRRIERAERRLQQQLIRAEDTRRRISRFLTDYPALAFMLNNLRYRDKNGIEHHLYVLVHTGSLDGDIRVAQTKFQINDRDQLSCLLPGGERVEHAVLVTLDKRQFVADALPHELGHILALAANPRAYFELLRKRPWHFDCQSQLGHPVAMPAIAMQER